MKTLTSATFFYYAADFAAWFADAFYCDWFSMGFEKRGSTEGF